MKQNTYRNNEEDKKGVKSQKVQYTWFIGGRDCNFV